MPVFAPDDLPLVECHVCGRTMTETDSLVDSFGTWCHACHDAAQDDDGLAMCSCCGELFPETEQPDYRPGIDEHLCAVCQALPEVDPLPEKPHEFYPKPENWKGR